MRKTFFKEFMKKNDDLLYNFFGHHGMINFNENGEKRVLSSAFYDWLTIAFIKNNYKVVVFENNEHIFGYNGEYFHTITGFYKLSYKQRVYIFNPAIIPNYVVHHYYDIVSMYSDNNILYFFASALMSIIFLSFYIMLVSVIIHHRLIDTSFQIFLVPIILYFLFNFFYYLFYGIILIHFHWNLMGGSFVKKNPIRLYDVAKVKVTEMTVDKESPCIKFGVFAFEVASMYWKQSCLERCKDKFVYMYKYISFNK